MTKLIVIAFLNIAWVNWAVLPDGVASPLSADLTERIVYCAIWLYSAQPGTAMGVMSAGKRMKPPFLEPEPNPSFQTWQPQQSLPSLWRPPIEAW